MQCHKVWFLCSIATVYVRSLSPLNLKTLEHQTYCTWHGGNTWSIAFQKGTVGPTFLEKTWKQTKQKQYSGFTFPVSPLDQLVSWQFSNRSLHCNSRWFTLTTAQKLSLKSGTSCEELQSASGGLFRSSVVAKHWLTVLWTVPTCGRLPRSSSRIPAFRGSDDYSTIAQLASHWNLTSLVSP